jgi:hypothetical protein
MKVIEVPSYECAHCGCNVAPFPQGVSPEMTHVLLEHPTYMSCPYNGKMLRVPVHLVEGELVAESEDGEPPDAS